MLEASRAAGPNIVGFYEIVEEHYNDYYRVLIGHVADIDPDASMSTVPLPEKIHGHE